MTPSWWQTNSKPISISLPASSVMYFVIYVSLFIRTCFKQTFGLCRYWWLNCRDKSFPPSHYKPTTLIWVPKYFFFWVSKENLETVICGTIDKPRSVRTPCWKINNLFHAQRICRRLHSAQYSTIGFNSHNFGAGLDFDYTTGLEHQKRAQLSRQKPSASSRQPTTLKLLVYGSIVLTIELDLALTIE